ncbi:hypothetical protein SBOR_4630 [Sclerotinia borealis F-4128]|uniref:Autophagy-related protein 101 n=1 Tax=Sclerotinia borealis (strain F-4128) TaxID=1432307 RepID=W9CKE9_SCLBF|nr:hypothetical protein SBOR_4630 [Sclerotinia borealis F-4128]
MTLPYIENVEIETLIDQRTAALVRQLDTSSDLGARNTGVRGQMAVQFFEKKRRKAWFTKGEEEVCWEQWTLDVTLATPRTESGKEIRLLYGMAMAGSHCVPYRTSESQKCDGGHVTESRNEDRDNG